MISHDELYQLKKEVTSRLPAMKGLASDCHWLVIPSKTRSTFVKLFARLSLEEVSRLTGWPIESWRRWMKEKIAIEDLSRRVSSCRSGNTGRVLSNTALVRAEILALVELVPPSIVIREIGVPRSTLDAWRRRAGTDQTKITTPMPEKNDPAHLETIAENTDAQRLKGALARHDGKIRRQYSPSERKRIMHLADQFGSKAVRDYFSISYDTIARWKRRKGQDFQTRRRTPLRYIPVVELMREHPGMGPMQIRNYLRRHKGLSMSVASIRRVMEENGWVPPFAKVRRLPESAERYEAARRNYLWHLDFKHQWINGFKAFFFFIQDDYSRFVVGHAIVDGEKVDAVIDAVDQAISLHGRPECIMSDGGSAFKSWRGVGRFTRFLEDYGIEQVIAKTPNVNGKLENLHQQLEKELLMPTQFSSLQHCSDELSKWVGFYNFQRPHQGLSGTQTPSDRYYPGAKTGMEAKSQLHESSKSVIDLLGALMDAAQKKE